MANAAQPICVVENTTVAGTRHIPDVETLTASYQQGERLVFTRDGGNPFDPWAVSVHDAQGARIGYVSCECNEVVARLMDGGKAVEGRLTAKEQIGAWTRLVMEVYLND